MVETPVIQGGFILEGASEKYIHNSDFERVLWDLADKIGRADSPTEALLIISQVEALLKEMKIWINKYQSDETEWKKYLEQHAGAALRAAYGLPPRPNDNNG